MDASFLKQINTMRTDANKLKGKTLRGSTDNRKGKPSGKHSKGRGGGRC